MKSGPGSPVSGGRARGESARSRAVPPQRLVLPWYSNSHQINGLPANGGLDVIVSRTKFGLALLVCLVFLGVGQSADDIPGSQPKRAERKDYYGDPLPPGVLVRMGTVRLRHFGATAVFSADGKTLISAGWDQFVRHWDLATGKQINCTKMQTANEQDFSYLLADKRLSTLRP